MTRPDNDNIRILKQGHLVTLKFDNGLMQSQIDTNRPGQLPQLANRMMLVHLMFGIEPENVLLAGSGGGAVGLWFNSHMPQTRGLGIEASAEVISLAKEHFGFPPDNPNWQIEQADIRQYFRSTKQKFDFILFDIEENGVTPDWLVSDEVLQDCISCLSEQGVATFNIVAQNAESFARILWSVRQAFPQRTLCLSHPATGNIIISAFKNRPSTNDLTNRATLATERFNIEFDLFYQQLLKDNPANSGIF